MFQRLKGFNLDSFLDSKIAEEQARQRGGNASPSKRPSSSARRGTVRPASSSRTPSDKGPPGRAPDPSEFIIDDEDFPSRATTPRPPQKEGDDVVAVDSPSQEAKDAETDNGNQVPEQGVKPDVELPQDVQLKLRKLNKLESRYHDLLRSYRAAHARVSAIEPFEAALREHTPLTSISDPSALVEYLSQIILKGDMVMDELKRVSAERDTIKKKLDDAEKQTKDAYDEATGLRMERDEAREKQALHHAADPVAGEVVSAEPGPENGANGHGEAQADQGNDFFSYESEVPRLQEEVEQKSRQVEELTAENGILRSDLETAKQSHQKTSTDLEHVHQAQASEHEDAELGLDQRCKDAEDSLTQVRHDVATCGVEMDARELPDRIRTLGELLKSAQTVDEAARVNVADLTARSGAAEQALAEYEAKYQALEESREIDDSTNDKRAQTLEHLVTSLKDKIKDAEDDKREAEAGEAAIRAKLDEAEQKYALLEGQKTGEALSASEIASLQKQLKTVQHDRTTAYAMILACGECKAPKEKIANVPAEAPVEPTNIEHATPGTPIESAAAESGATTGQKKGKGKNKKKKKGPGPSSTTIADESTQVEAADTLDTTASAPADDAKAVDHTLLVDGLTEEQITAIRTHVVNARGEITANDGAAASQELVTELQTVVSEKEAQIKQLSADIQDKDAAIDRLHARLKGEEDLREEIEGLKDDLMQVGNEHVGAKHQLKTLRSQMETAEKEHVEALKELQDQRHLLKERCTQLETELGEVRTTSGSSNKELEERLAVIVAEKMAVDGKQRSFEKQISDLKAGHETARGEAEQKHTSLSKSFDELKEKSTTLQRDLSAANDLAQSRYKDLTGLREHLNKMQPELSSLRKEASELKTVKDEMRGANEKMRRLEGQEKELHSEIAKLKTQTQEKEVDVKNLSEKVKQSSDRIAVLEKAEKDLQRSEVQKREVTDAKDKLSQELSKAQDELQKSRTALQDLERQISQFREDTGRVKNELELRSAQQASAQSLMDNMQDQTRELATQMKEVRERCESLEEELADSHRLLSERSREGETMRRLLADVEGRADSRVKEMRERMDLAIEERDRAEDEASTASRRRAREVEELRNKLRDAEKDRTRAVEEKETFEKRESMFQSQRDELERRAAQALDELAEVRTAMTQLRDALDQGERQSRDLEKEKTGLKRALDDKEQRLEKLQKSSKSMADDLKALQSKARQSSLTSARSSLESVRIGSPGRNGHVATTGGPDAQPATDFVYLKNVLLQFLEQKDKKHQMQLVPVLGMLLHFDKKDEQKWNNAITALRAQS